MVAGRRRGSRRTMDGADTRWSTWILLGFLCLVLSSALTSCSRRKIFHGLRAGTTISFVGDGKSESSSPEERADLHIEGTFYLLPADSVFSLRVGSLVYCYRRGVQPESLRSDEKDPLLMLYAQHEGGQTEIVLYGLRPDMTNTFGLQDLLPHVVAEGLRARRQWNGRIVNPGFPIGDSVAVRYAVSSLGDSSAPYALRRRLEARDSVFASDPALGLSVTLREDSRDWSFSREEDLLEYNKLLVYDVDMGGRAVSMRTTNRIRFQPPQPMDDDLVALLEEQWAGVRAAKPAWFQQPHSAAAVLQATLKRAPGGPWYGPLSRAADKLAKVVAGEKLKRWADMVGREAPAFSLEDIHGSPLRMEDLRGRLVVLTFFGLSCPGCRIEAGELVDLWQRHREDPLAIVAVNVWNDSVDALRSYAEALKIRYPILVHGGVVAEKYRVVGVPLTFILDPDGKVLEYFCGASGTAHDLSSCVDSLLARFPTAGSR